jgi:hypothetical protein
MMYEASQYRRQKLNIAGSNQNEAEQNFKDLTNLLVLHQMRMKISANEERDKMVKSYCSIGLTSIMLFVLISLTIGGASALPVNETVKNFRISFDAIDDTNMVAKVWSDGPMLGGSPIKGPTNELASGVFVMAGNASDPYKRWGMCGIFVLKNPENTSIIEKKCDAK